MADDMSAEAMEARLFELGQQADAGDIDRDSIDSSQFGELEQPDAQEEESQRSIAKETGGETQPPAADPKTQEPNPQTPKAQEPKQEAEKQSDEADPKDSKYVKAQKDAARLERNWNKLQEERAAFEREKAEAAKAREVQPQTTQQAAEPAVKDEHGYTSADYEKAAKDFEAEGESQLANAARQKAEAMRGAETQRAQAEEQKSLIQSWEAKRDEILAKPERADLLNPEHPLSKSVMALLHNEPLLSQIPDGFARAVEIAELRMTAGSVPELKAQNDKLRADLAEAQKRLEIHGSNPAKPPVERSFSSLSAEEQESAIRRMASEADREAA